jgi:hypothetical protein
LALVIKRAIQARHIEVNLHFVATSSTMWISEAVDKTMDFLRNRQSEPPCDATRSIDERVAGQVAEL